MNSFVEGRTVVPLKREQLRQATQRRVVETAGRLFQQRGFAATTIRDIAEASGVSIGTVMAAGDKNGLLVRVFDALIEAEHAQREGVGAAAGSGHEHSCVDRVMNVVHPFVSLFIGQQDLARVYASILVSGDHSSTLFTDLAARLVDEFHAALTEHGCTSPDAAAPRAAALYFAYVGTLFTWSARGSADPTELCATLRATFTAICACKE